MSKKEEWKETHRRWRLRRRRNGNWVTDWQTGELNRFSPRIGGYEWTNQRAYLRFLEIKERWGKDGLPF